MDLHGVGDDESDDWANVLADVGTEHGETISLRSADISGTNCSISSPTTQANTDKFTDDCWNKIRSFLTPAAQCTDTTSTN